VAYFFRPPVGQACPTLGLILVTIVCYLHQFSISHPLILYMYIQAYYLFGTGWSL